jgi:hypothetical protein
MATSKSTLTKVTNLIHRNMVVLGVYCGCLDPSESKSEATLPPTAARSAVPRTQLRKLLKCIGIVREDDPGRGGAFLGHHRGHQHQQGAAVPARQPGGHRAGGHGAPLAPCQLSRKFPKSLFIFVEISFFFSILQVSYVDRRRRLEDAARWEWRSRDDLLHPRDPPRRVVQAKAPLAPTNRTHRQPLH